MKDLKLTRCRTMPYKVYFTYKGERYFILKYEECYECDYCLYLRMLGFDGKPYYVEFLDRLTYLEISLFNKIVTEIKETKKYRTRYLEELVNSFIARNVLSD